MTLRDLGEHFRDQRVNSPDVKRQVDAAKQLFNKRAPDMTLRDELEMVMKTVRNADSNAYGSLAHDRAFNQGFSFLRTHGPALLEALKDQARYDWIYRNWVLVTKARGTFGEFEIPHGAASIDLSKAIDRARGGES